MDVRRLSVTNFPQGRANFKVEQVAFSLSSWDLSKSKHTGISQAFWDNKETIEYVTT